MKCRLYNIKAAQAEAHKATVRAVKAELELGNIKKENRSFGEVIDLLKARSLVNSRPSQDNPFGDRITVVLSRNVSRDQKIPLLRLAMAKLAQDLDILGEWKLDGGIPL